jgi:PIN domain nuclease of toxin-antitoxin system
VKLLIDTHIWLWLTAEPERIGSAAIEALVSESNEVYLSAASAWEIVIKHSLGKLDLPLPPAAYVPSRVAALGHTPLPIAMEHTLAVADLPLHHKDPFDRLLVAQARVEGMHLVTADHLIRGYDVPLVWAGT